MADAIAALLGGFPCISQEVVTNFAASKQMFANAPIGTRKILFEIKDQSLRIRMENTAATVANGILWATGVYEVDLTQSEALLWKAIETAASAELRVGYFGRRT